MQMRNSFSMACLAAGAILWLPLSATAAEAPESAETCVSCHGDNGVSTEDEIPIIAGASSFFLENQLMIYQKEARPCVAEEFGEEEHDDVDAKDHCALVADFSEDRIAELAGYFAEQSFEPAEQSFDKELAKKGESIHQRSCDKCHAQAGTLKLDDAGILAGQWKPYMLKQLRHYKEGERWQPEKMEPKMTELSEEDIKALAEYYASEGPEQF